MFRLVQTTKCSISAVIAAFFVMSVPAMAAAAGAPRADAAPTHAPAKTKATTKTAKTKAATKGTPKPTKTTKRAAAKATAAHAKAPKAKAKKKVKSTASKQADSEARGAQRRPCDKAKIAVDRAGLEREVVTLTTCSGLPLASAQQRLSVLARPWSAPGPSAKELSGEHQPGEELAEGVRLLDEGLVRRIAAIAAKFPDASLSLVSGYRPNSRSEKHESGRALDVRLVNGSTAELAAFCRTLPNTGCGYYPNSMFVHIDVRSSKEGSASWIDASGPGEPSQFVSEWPPPPPTPASTLEGAAGGKSHD